MERRRELMAMPHGLDTSPVIEHTGLWTRTFGKLSESDNDWCITKFYDTDDAPDGTLRSTFINGYVGNDTTSITFQYYLSNGSTDYWYFAGTNPRRLLGNEDGRRVSRISFSIEKTKLKDSYAYIVETGKILFAGENTPYYGHTNVSELN